MPKPASVSTKRAPRSTVTQPTSSASNAPQRQKLVTLRNYTNIFDLVDGLKYQLPEYGRELCISTLIDLLVRDVDVSAAIRSHRNIIDTSSFESVGFNGDPLCYDKELMSRTNWTELSTMLTPLFSMTATELAPGATSISTSTANRTTRASSGVVNTISGRLRSAFIMNPLLRRFDNCVSRLSNSMQHVAQSNSVFSVSDEEDDPGDGSSSLPSNSDNNASSSTAAKSMRKVLLDIRNRTNQALVDEIGPEASATLLASSNVCECCFFSPTLLLYCSLNESAIVDVAETSQSAASMRAWSQQHVSPTLAFDVAFLLCARLDSTQFEKDFVLRHLPTKSTDKKAMTWSSLAKLYQVSNMGFFIRAYALHCAVHMIIDWLWTRQRLCHSCLFTNQPIIDSPPVTIVIANELRPLFSNTNFLPFRILTQSHKVVLKYI